MQWPFIQVCIVFEPREEAACSKTFYVRRGKEKERYEGCINLRHRSSFMYTMKGHEPPKSLLPCWQKVFFEKEGKLVCVSLTA